MVAIANSALTRSRWDAVPLYCLKVPPGCLWRLPRYLSISALTTLRDTVNPK